MTTAWRPPAAAVVVHAAKSALACGLSWYVAADVLGNHIPVFAPLAALLTVQTTVHESVSRGIQRVAGVVVGVLVAFGFARLAGIHAWSIAVIVLVGLLVGRAFRLGAQGAIQVPVSALLVLAVGATRGGYGSERIVDTALGAAIGIALAFVPGPPARVQRAASDLGHLAAELGDLLHTMANHLAPGAGGRSPVVVPDEDLAWARRLSRQAASVADAVARAEESVRWDVAGRRRRPAVTRMEATVGVLRLVDVQARGIARSLADTSTGSAIPPEVSRPLSALVGQAADNLVAWAGPSSPVDGAAPLPLDTGRAGYLTALDAIRGADMPAEAAAAATAIAVDARRILDQLAAAPQWATDDLAAGRRA